MHPLVSIITPTYNHEKYIAECIISVQNQIYSNWEMIIVDDGSTDRTYEIAKQLASNDSRIKVFTQENKGIFKLAETYNFALQKSVGSLIAVLEGDDVWLPKKLVLQVQEFEKNKEIILCWGQAFSSSNDLKVNYELMPTKRIDKSVTYNNPLKSALRGLIFNNHMPALTVMVRREILLNIGGFVQKYNLPLVDMPTWQACACIGEFSFINEPVGKWRNSLGQATKTFNIEMINGLRKLAIELFESNKAFFCNTNVSLNKIESYFNSRLVVNHYKMGLYCIKRNDKQKARNEFKAAIKTKGFIKLNWKVKAVIKLVTT